MIYVLHSSKTMQTVAGNHELTQIPLFLRNAEELHTFLASLSTSKLQDIMHVSENLAKSIHKQVHDWNTEPQTQTLAIDSFRGDIFSGLRASSLSASERAYANQHLIFLSGLYGLIRPFDSIMPYRLEMGYSLKGFKTTSLYEYWGTKIADTVSDQTILNLSSVEYSKVLTKYIAKDKIYSPRFLSLDSKTNTYKNVAVHAKIARGAFARWAIQNRISDPKKLIEFKDLGYIYNKKLSSEHGPTFTCEIFQGLGLSVRMQA